jgi:hypothetical protein
VASRSGEYDKGLATLLARVDHLVYATPDLQRGVREIEQILGIRATNGGQHPGRGTRNALVALGSSAYLEIIGPDPDQPAPATSRWFAIDDLETSKLVTWAAKTDDIDRLHHLGAANGIPIGEVRSGSRQRSDGVLLSWRLTEPARDMANGVIPFFIDWGESPHPSLNATHGAQLIELCAEHPENESVERSLRMLGLEMSVSRAKKAALIAFVDGPLGRVELR